MHRKCSLHYIGPHIRYIHHKYHTAISEEHYVHLRLTQHFELTSEGHQATMIVMEHVEDAVTPVVQISDSIRSFFRFAHFVCRPCPALSGLLVLVPLSAWSAWSAC